MERLLIKLKQHLRAIGRRPPGADEAADPQRLPSAGMRTELDPAVPVRRPSAGDPSPTHQPRVSDSRTRKATLSLAARRALHENAPSLWGIVASAATDAWGRPAPDAPPMLSGATLASLTPAPPPSAAPARLDPQATPAAPFLEGASPLSPVQDATATSSFDLLGPATDFSASGEGGSYERPF
jgi:hypothetical protein